jgi:hypothetical protein
MSDFLGRPPARLRRVSARSREFGERFYAILFKANPELRPLFQSDLRGQMKMFASRT